MAVEQRIDKRGIFFADARGGKLVAAGKLFAVALGPRQDDKVPLGTVGESAADRDGIAQTAVEIFVCADADRREQERQGAWDLRS